MDPEFWNKIRDKDFKEALSELKFFDIEKFKENKKDYSIAQIIFMIDSSLSAFSAYKI